MAHCQRNGGYRCLRGPGLRRLQHVRWRARVACAAIENADLAGGSTILFATSGTISLESALPAISLDVDMVGPGALDLTVNGNSAYQVFDIESIATATISGLTISNGFSATSGGGIENDGTSR